VEALSEGHEFHGEAVSPLLVDDQIGLGHVIRLPLAVLLA
jgi:hypothetical protein